jgi:hypothetical protein
VKTFSHEEKVGHEIHLSWPQILTYLKLDFKIRSTGVVSALCPFHREKTPSVRLWEKSGQFRCHGCGVGGDKVDFVGWFYGVTSLEEIDEIVSSGPGNRRPVPVDEQQLLFWHDHCDRCARD